MTLNELSLDSGNPARERVYRWAGMTDFSRLAVGEKTRARLYVRGGKGRAQEEEE
jgi:hypothetical protein